MTHQMSNFGPPPGPPPGAPQDPARGPQPQAPPWAQQAYVPSGPPLATWVQRMASGLVDAVLLVPFYLVASVGGGLARESGFIVTGLGVLAIVAGWFGFLAFAIWNQVIRQGRTGHTIGKRLLRIKLVGKDPGSTAGVPLTLFRQALNAIGWVLIFLTYYGGFAFLFFGSVVCLVNYLWPLWDRRRQTLADKLVGTLVVGEARS
ncbi:RDD family protein [Nocardioides sp. YR527]|uniref:RDD family protein n=1 Tax=Nocardioides sp. YR527 TaxID=1881028 RepID=UPI000B83F7A1|nr:RDD family protein [Nocardioides sp. YR527]